MPKPTRISWTTKSGKKVTRWQVRYKDRAGRRRSSQFDTKGEADDFADTVTSAVRAGRHTHNRDTITVAQAAERWLAACARGRHGRDPCEPKTLDVYEQFVRLHIVPALGGSMLNTLTPGRVRQFRDLDMLEGGRSRYLTAKVLTALSAICSDAVGDELMPINPCTGIKLVSNRREKAEVTIPSKDQVRAIMEVAERWANGNTSAVFDTQRGPMRFAARITRWRALWWYGFLRFLITTGCRSSEVRGAPWSAIEGSVFSVRQRADYKGTIGPPKSAAGWRDLDLDDGMLAVLDRWRPVAPKSKANLIFPGTGGAPEQLSNISKRLWFPMLREAGIAKLVRGPDGTERHDSPFTIHDLRHFHASLMIEANMKEKQLQAHMGHSSIKVTLDIYGHLFMDDEARAQRRSVVTGATAGLLAAPTPTASGLSAPQKRQSKAENSA
jgi:integrase